MGFPTRAVESIYKTRPSMFLDFCDKCKVPLMMGWTHSSSYWKIETYKNSKWVATRDNYCDECMEDSIHKDFGFEYLTYGNFDKRVKNLDKYCRILTQTCDTNCLLSMFTDSGGYKLDLSNREYKSWIFTFEEWSETQDMFAEDSEDLDDCFSCEYCGVPLNDTSEKIGYHIRLKQHVSDPENYGDSEPYDMDDDWYLIGGSLDQPNVYCVSCTKHYFPKVLEEEKKQ